MKTSQHARVGLVLDNLSFHRSKETNDLMKELSIVPLRLVAYNSQYNSAEFVFLLAKRIFRKELLILLMYQDIQNINGLALVDNIFANLKIPETF